MPKVVFQPSGVEVDVDAATKILVAAKKAKVEIRYGCGACRCGTCAVSLLLSVDGELSPMQDDERTLLKRIGLSTDGHIRLTCRAKVTAGTCIVDLAFQNTYTPMEVEDEGVSDVVPISDDD